MRLFTALLFAVALTVSGCAHTNPRDQMNRSVQTGVARALDGVPIAYDVRGAGEPALVFIHCWSCDRTFWREQVEVFATDHQVVTMDLAGHGESGRNRERWSVSGLAGDVEAVVESLGLERVILIGHSMGGPVALAAAARMPKRAAGVVAVDTLHDVEANWSEQDREQIIGAFEKDFDGAMDRFVRMLVRADVDPQLLEEMVERGQAVDRTAAVDLMRNFADLDLGDLLRAVEVPVRAINAAPAPPFQPATEVEANRKYADFDVVLISDVGHYIQLERPAFFNQRLRETLAELSADR